eukprot:g389.t1
MKCSTKYSSLAVLVVLVLLGIAFTNHVAYATKTLSKVNSLKHSISVVNALEAAKEEANSNEPSVGALEQVLHMLVEMKKTLRHEQNDDEEINLGRARRCMEKRLQHQKDIHLATNDLNSLIDDSKYVRLVTDIHHATKKAMEHYQKADVQAKEIAPLVSKLKMQLKNLQVQIMQREEKNKNIQGHLNSFNNRMAKGTSTIVPSENEVKEVNNALIEEAQSSPVASKIEETVQNSGRNWKSNVGKLLNKFSSELKTEETNHLTQMKEDLKKLNKTYSVPLEKLHKYEHTMKISLQAVDHATKALKFITQRHDTTKIRRATLNDQIKEGSEELKILMSACNSKKVEFEQRHTNRKEELETMGDLVQFLHQQLVIQQQKLSDSVELLKAGSLN